ncbi:ExbD/TolR family protein [Bdellovibrio sp. HCB337]|uniref:ExbD/TolR family protein n=1 Tax=Bdellovibrio sp. HCB337 TaxID=3394358 RepID=UPI0039A58316
MKKSALATTRRSPLMQSLALKAGNEKSAHGGVKELGLALPLTSLIDAFCIIVIYLLIGTQTSGVESQLAAGMSLPLAESGQTVDKAIATLKIEKGIYFLDEKQVSLKALGQKLAELKKSTTEAVELMVQADTQMEFADLDPLLKAGAEAGIEKLRFAVIPTK